MSSMSNQFPFAHYRSLFDSPPQRNGHGAVRTTSNRRKKLLTAGLAAAILFIAAQIPAGAETVIDVDSAVALAMHNNLGIATEQLKLEKNLRAKETVWNRFIPSISASATLGRLNSATQIASGLIADPTSAVSPGVYNRVIATPAVTLQPWSVSVRLQAQLTLSAQMVYGIRQTVLDYQAGVTSLGAARAKLERDVRKQFYNLLLIASSIDLQKQAIQTAEQRLAQTKANYQNGMVDEYTYLAAQVSLANLRPLLEEMQSGYDTALMAFNQTIGLGLSERPTLAGSIEAELIPITMADADRLTAKYLPGRYDILSLRQSVEQLRNVASLTEAGLYPTLTLGYTADPTFIRDPFADPWFANVNRDWQQMSGMFTITIGVRLDPLLPSSTTRVQIADYQNQARQVEDGLKQAIQGAEMEVRRIIMTLEKTRTTLSVKKLNVELATRALSLAEDGYRAGTRDLLDVRSAQQDLQKAQVDVLSDEYNYKASILDLEAALNTSINSIKDTINANAR